LTLDGKTTLSSKTEHYSILNIEIPGDLGIEHMDIYHCLDDYICSEILDGENEWFNENTKRHQPIQKRLRFLSFPRVLLIALKRFSPDGVSKNDTRVEFPVHGLDLNKYVPGTQLYNLYGVCYHTGLLRGGHYTSATRNPVTQQWYFYDDERIVDIPESKVGQLVSEHAYCLLYIRH
jgi:ubiquitin C-terminal hydrolase